MQSSRSSLWDLIPSRRTVRAAQTKSSGRTDEDVQYEKLTLGFIGLALGSVVGYFALLGSPIRIVVRKVDKDGEEEEYEEEGGDEGEDEDEVEGVEEEIQLIDDE